MGPLSWSFRRGLAQALPEWEEEGLITPASAARLRARYGLGGEEEAEQANFAVYLLGALLIFAGLASFVAWNWAALPPAVKVALGVVAMVGTEGLGFWLAFIDGRRPGLGQAFIVLGALMFGANLSLVGQFLNLAPSMWGFVTWSIASAGLAWAVRSVPCAALAATTLFIALGGDEGFVLARSPLFEHLAWLLVLGWGRWWRSGALSVTGLVGGAALLTIAAGRTGGLDLDFGGAVQVPLAFAVTGLGLSLRMSEEGQGVLRVAWTVLVVWAFACGFGVVADEVASGNRDLPLLNFLLTMGPPVLVGVALGLGAPSNQQSIEAWVGMVIAVLLSGAAFTAGWALWVVAHICLAARVLWDLRRSLRTLDRRPFWSAMVLAASVIVARFLEVEVGLLFKSAAFIASGLGVLVAGYVFETQRRRAIYDA